MRCFLRLLFSKNILEEGRAGILYSSFDIKRFDNFLSLGKVKVLKTFDALFQLAEAFKPVLLQ